MNLYNLDNINSKDITIDMNELNMFTQQLGKLIRIYRTKVYIEDEKYYQILDLLQNCYNKLVNHEYYDLINDPSIIID